MFSCVYRFFKSCIRPNIYQSNGLVTYKSIINNYNTLETLKDSGSQADIVLAIADKNREIAIKKYYKKSHYRRELDILNSFIKNTYIIQYLDHWIEHEDDEQIYCIAFPYYPNGDLYNTIKRNTPICEMECKYIFKKIINCVHQCHTNNIVHGDIKLENFLIDKDKLILIDFAMSHYKYKVENKKLNLGGTHSYCAPEVYLGDCDFYNDIWSLGVILYIMIEGSFPFNHNKFQSPKPSIDDYKQNKYPVLTIISPELEDLIDKMLDYDPNTRITLQEINEHPWLKKNNYTSMQICI